MELKKSPFNELVCVLALDCSYEEICDRKLMLSEIELYTGITGFEAEELIEKIQQLKLSFHEAEESLEIH